MALEMDFETDSTAYDSFHIEIDYTLNFIIWK